MNRTLKLSLVCTGIFACGVVAGGFGVKAFGPKRPPGFSSEGFGPHMMRRLTSELELTDAQRAAIDPLIQKTNDELRVLRRESVRQTTALIEAMDAAVAAELTPEQREKFNTLKTEQKARMKALMEERQRRRPDGGGDRREQGGERGPGGDRPPAPPAPTS